MPSEERVLLIVNPISGSLEKADVVDLIENRCKASELKLEVYSTTGENDLQTIVKLLDEYKPTRVLVAGGDGTITMVAQALEGKEAILGILPAGSSNGLATSFNVPADFMEALEVALSSNVARIDGVRINGEISLHLSDLGLNALLVKNFEEGDTRGKMGYAKEVIKTLTEHETFRVRIRTAEEVLETEAVMVVIANAQKYGTGVTINPYGNILDGLFEVVIAKRWDVIELVKLIAGSTEFDPEVVTMFSVTYAEIECLDQEVDFQIDGEYKGQVRKVTAQMVPQLLSIAIPEPQTV
ncbi:diacylglycerol kinase family protein [Telluribacter sp. SYSU D00476]|uniref:diacylglycerol/lipid kinase family protein n=1 Tax=Telluribacter sp. SYSU D00476 TaxID=2811430 RepID=UPI001FF2F965|nr:diacylglycerol kinase family protein [Telluribacter sp. SYSU D00476]